MINEFSVTVTGRPAPQGSKKTGAHGQMRESSVYLPAWRQAIKRDVYAQYKATGVEPEDLPLFRGAVSMGVTFWLDTTDPTQPPDLDKLLRGLWDGLTQARVWEDDARVVEILWASKAHRGDGLTGATLRVVGAGGIRRPAE
jgi:Holliday junction resolvase RusA-like endonuclease